MTASAPAAESPTVERRRVLESSMLRLFNSRCHDLGQRVRTGTISFIDAIDMAYSAAEWSGLIDLVGDDRVQACMAEAFMGLRR